MKLSKILLVVGASLLLSAQAWASATYSVVATTGDGSPLNNITPGTTLTLEVTLVTSAPNELFGIGGSVNDYDRAIVTPDAGASSIAPDLLYSTCIPTYGCFGGSTNLESGLRVQFGVEGAGAEDTFVSILGTSPAAGDGTLDTAVYPNGQFTIVYDVLPGASGSTVLRVGTYENYADAYAGASDDIVNNVEVAITVPEPSSVAARLIDAIPSGSEARDDPKSRKPLGASGSFLLGLRLEARWVGQRRGRARECWS